MVWSKTSLPELEAAKKWVNEQDRGTIQDSAQLATVKEFLSTHSHLKTRVEKDAPAGYTTVWGSGKPLVHLLRLEHR